MTVQYIAEDGTIFDNPEDCEIYEAAKNLFMLSHLTGFDENWNKLDPAALNFLDEVVYLYIPTDESYSNLISFCRCQDISYSVEGLPGPGIYCYNFYTEEWDKTEDELKRLYKEVEEIRNIERKLRGK